MRRRDLLKSVALVPLLSLKSSEGAGSTLVEPPAVKFDRTNTHILTYDDAERWTLKRLDGSISQFRDSLWVEPVDGTWTITEHARKMEIRRGFLDVYDGEPEITYELEILCRLHHPIELSNVLFCVKPEDASDGQFWIDRVQAKDWVQMFLHFGLVGRATPFYWRMDNETA